MQHLYNIQTVYAVKKNLTLDRYEFREATPWIRVMQTCCPALQLYCRCVVVDVMWLLESFTTYSLKPFLTKFSASYWHWALLCFGQFANSLWMLVNGNHNDLESILSLKCKDTHIQWLIAWTSLLLEQQKFSQSEHLWEKLVIRCSSLPPPLQFFSAALQGHQDIIQVSL